MSELLVEKKGAILHVQFNRPEKKNAINKDMYSGLTAALVDATNDFGIRVVVLSGAGTTFTAGNDIFDFMDDIPTDDTAPGFQFIKAIHNFPKPLIAAVQGSAVGIGTTALLHCDIVIAASNAKFSMPFVTLGLVPEAGSSYLFPKLVGHAKASEIFLTGRSFGAAEALDMGLLNLIDEDPLARAMEIAELISGQPPTSVLNTKALLKSGHHGQVEAVMSAEGLLFRIALESDEAQSAFMKFMSSKKKG